MKIKFSFDEGDNSVMKRNTVIGFLYGISTGSISNSMLPVV